ncbi:hypothetical protein L9F63_007947, partial [Diploptera punctata]
GMFDYNCLIVFLYNVLFRIPRNMLLYLNHCHGSREEVHGYPNVMVSPWFCTLPLLINDCYIHKHIQPR